MSGKINTRIIKIFDLIIILIAYYTAVLAVISNNAFQTFVSCHLGLLWYFLIFRQRKKEIQEKNENNVTTEIKEKK